jgi:hypothetical protein
MSAEYGQSSRAERIKLLATQNRRRRERSFLSAEIGKITGRVFAGDEFQVASGVGEIDQLFAGMRDSGEFGRSFPEGYPERNRHLFAQFGRTIPERSVHLYVRLTDVWCFRVSSETAFSCVPEFADLESSFSRYSGSSFRAMAPDSRCGLDLSLHKYYHSTNNRWECYRKSWELGVLGRGWGAIAERVFAP